MNLAVVPTPDSTASSENDHQDFSGHLMIEGGVGRRQGPGTKRLRNTHQDGVMVDIEMRSAGSFEEECHREQ
jgi:hypothetical protein